MLKNMCKKERYQMSIIVNYIMHHIFAKFVNIIPRKLPEENDEPRLVLPFFDEYENLIGFSGRAFSKNAVRYITIMIEEDKPKYLD